jgi:hypothetical protein
LTGQWADPVLLRRIVARMVALVPPDTDVLGGFELGGVPLATILSSLTGIPALFVRKEAKTYGTLRLAEGGDPAGRQVLLIEDVITTCGASAQRSSSSAGARRDSDDRCMRHRPTRTRTEPTLHTLHYRSLGDDVGPARFSRPGHLALSCGRPELPRRARVLVRVRDPATGRPEAAVSGDHMLRWRFGLRAGGVSACLAAQPTPAWSADQLARLDAAKWMSNRPGSSLERVDDWWDTLPPPSDEPRARDFRRIERET